MKPARFAYFRPDTLHDALALLTQHGADAAVLAGGQSLMPLLNLRFARPTCVIDIKRVVELDQIRLDGDRLVIGALARHADVLASHLLRDHAPLLHMALAHVAHAAIRNRGTAGGSLALADPAAEWPACAVCLDATIVVASTKGARNIPAQDFFRGIYTTAISDAEIIVRIEIPVTPRDWSWDFDEIARRRGDFAMAGLALGLRRNAGSIDDCRVVFCGVEAAPRRITAVERLLAGRNSTPATSDLDRVLLEALDPLHASDIPAKYRVHLAGVLLNRALVRLGLHQHGQ